MVEVVVRGLSLSFGDNRIFEDLNLRLSAPTNGGNVVAVAGRSGAGKSSFLRALAGLERGAQRAVLLTPADAYLAYLPQEVVLFDHLSINDNVTFLGRSGPGANRFCSNACEAACDLLGVSTLTGAVRSLSGGEKQRIALARALAVRPDVLLLDEPCTGLDWDSKTRLLRDLRLACSDRQMLVVYVTHHLDEIELVADDVLFFHRKSRNHPVASEFGAASTLIANPPSLDIARFVSREPLNVVNGMLEGGDLSIPELKTSFAIPAGLDNLGACLLAVPASCLRPSGPIAIARVERSGIYSLLLPTDSESWLLGKPENSPQPLSLGIAGHLDLFRPTGERLGSIDI